MTCSATFNLIHYHAKSSGYSTAKNVRATGDSEKKSGAAATGSSKDKTRLWIRYRCWCLWPASHLCLHSVARVSGSNYDPCIQRGMTFFRLNNGDISQKVAQAASCLNNKVFARTLDIVRKALSEDSEPRKLAATTYVSLIRSYTISMVSKVAAWMEDAERALVLKEVLSARYTVDSPLVKCAIFFWVCRQLKVRSGAAIASSPES